MLVWQSTLQAFRNLLKSHGAFRDVRTWRLCPSADDDFQLYAGLEGEIEPSQPQELVANYQNRLILLVSDCKSAPWYNGEIMRLLECWQQKHLVTLVHMLPQSLWDYCALRESSTTPLRASGVAPLNTQLKYAQGLNGHSTNSLKLPVIHMEPGSIGQWAKVVTGKSWAPLLGVLLEPDVNGELAEPIEFKTGKFPKTSSVTELTEHFEKTASEQARILASYLAVVPLTMPVIRLVQQTMLPQSGQLELAEIFLSGLLIDHPLDSDPELMEYDFHVGVRDVLLNTVSPDQEKFIVRMVSDFIKSHFGQASDFQVLLSDPTDIGGTMVDQHELPLAEVDSNSLRRFGGDYKKLIRRLNKNNKAVMENAEKGLNEQSRFTWQNIKNVKDDLSEITQTVKNKLTNKTDNSFKQESIRLFKVMEAVSQRLQRIESEQSRQDKTLHTLREFPVHVVEFEAELARIDSERYQRRVDLTDYSIYREIPEVEALQSEFENIDKHKTAVPGAASQPQIKPEVDPILISELKSIHSAEADTVPLPDSGDSQDFARDNTEVEEMEAELEEIRRRKDEFADAELSGEASEESASAVPSPESNQGYAYIICLMFNSNSPHEWTENSGGGWRKAGEGTLYTEPAEVQLCLRKLKKRWPSYPLKVVQR